MRIVIDINDDYSCEVSFDNRPPEHFDQIDTDQFYGQDRLFKRGSIEPFDIIYNGIKSLNIKCRSNRTIPLNLER